MDEKQWLKDAIAMALKQRHLSNDELAKAIVVIVEAYEAMKEGN